jgi:hypothetical protein
MLCKKLLVDIIALAQDFRTNIYFKKEPIPIPSSIKNIGSHTGPINTPINLNCCAYITPIVPVKAADAKGRKEKGALPAAASRYASQTAYM